ncbi:hypothetical protein GGI25_002046 [Coemansia spiralis]|uniref:Pro-apoptotic serine protease NMA111 n=2 Tax=Coemansia TaxID=4863 RepID=A0A9W8GBJ2_9FUNG|nr:hypothetical protein EDC05_002659 [Coemansia umbellata]KAJ2623302.1 hypothetical protein GGI26_002530 [Coemansia sp. RSA 1358]KAJ2678853.1 hypothetical protein GGI25_002046 [Coemansia spiralis]
MKVGTVAGIAPTSEVGGMAAAAAAISSKTAVSTNAAVTSAGTLVKPEMEKEAPQYSWNTIQERLRTSVVSITMSFPTAFEEVRAHNAYATGFVVDSELGIIMSNRHVMGPGPSYHKATFFDNQEVHLQPAYFDPVHDFSFFRYDPSELQNIKPKAIRLAPEKARSGLEFRIVGNNSNEKMSVHQGELSQLDRNPPRYGGSYRDFNTFYFQASSTSKGGSSGSPVVDIEGNAVAINSGAGYISSTTFLLPLERAVYALEYVRKGHVPPRGTIQAVFKHVTHTQIERLGLSPGAATSEGVKIETTTGMLTINKVLPGGPADKILEVGDIIISVNSKAIPGFTEIFDIIDASVGQELQFRVFRKGQFYNLAVSVGDLYDITPSKVLRIGCSFVHNLSYQQAVKWSAPIYGVYVAYDRNGFLPSSKLGSCNVIYAVNGIPTPNVDALMSVLQNVKRNQPLVIKTKNHQDLRDESVFVTRHPPVTLPNAIYTRSSITGFWAIEPYSGLAADESAGVSASLVPNNSVAVASSEEDKFAMKQCPANHVAVDGRAGAHAGPANDISLVSGRGSQTFVQSISKSAVQISSFPITPADGQYCSGSSGTGLVVDKRRGVVLCSTRSVKNPTCNIWITFSGLICVKAKLAHTHPLYPIAFLKYNPADLAKGSNGDDSNGLVIIDEIDVESGIAESNRNSSYAQPLAVGTPVTVVSGTVSDGIEITATTVSERRLLSISACNDCIDKRFFNIDTFLLSPAPSSDTHKLGTVYSWDGELCGIWMQLPGCHHTTHGAQFVGLDISLVRSALGALQLDNSNIGAAYMFDVQFSPVSLDTARVLGASAQYIKEILQIAPHGQGVFQVCRTLRRRENSDKDFLGIGDIVLKIDGKLLTRIEDVACLYGRKSAELIVIRNMQEIVLTVKTQPLSATNTRHIVCWAGMYMQAPHEAALEKANRAASNVYMFSAMGGAPIYNETCDLNMFITEIDDEPIKSLDDIVRVVKKLKSKDMAQFNAKVASTEQFRSGKMPGCDVKLHSVTLSGEDNVYSIRTNDHYFPSWQIRRGPLADDEWMFEEI